MKLSQEDFTNAYILMMTGLADWYNEKEMRLLYSEYGLSTIEFPTNSPKKAIVRIYTIDGTIDYLYNYKSGELNGKAYSYHSDGVLWWEEEYKNGKLHGKFINYVDGVKEIEEMYFEGERVIT